MTEPDAKTLIIDAAIESFAEYGFLGASTRDIARRANTSQGLLTYHFKNKETLWKAAIDRLMGGMFEELGPADLSNTEGRTEEERLQDLIKFLSFSARKPYLFSFILDAGKEVNDRTRYLIDTYAKPAYQRFFSGLPEELQDSAPQLFYAFVGACNTIYAIQDEARYLTGRSPTSKAAIEKHARIIQQIFPFGKSG